MAQIQRDQVEDYAKRKEISLREAERWLAPNPGYEVDRLKTESKKSKRLSANTAEC